MKPTSEVHSAHGSSGSLTHRVFEPVASRMANSAGFCENFATLTRKTMSWQCVFHTSPLKPRTLRPRDFWSLPTVHDDKAHSQRQ